MRKISSNTDYKSLPEGIRFIAIKNDLRYLVLILKYSSLLVLLFLLAGHERENPKIGNTTIEFFSSDFRHGILLNINNTEVFSYNDNLEKKLLYWFYSERQFQPAWTLNYQSNNSYKDFITLIETAENYGLFSSLYLTDNLELFYNKMLNSSDDRERLTARVKFEKTATTAAFRFMIHLASGLGNYDTTSLYLNFVNNLPSYLNEQIDQKRIQEGILNVQPKCFEYTKLQAALEKYINMASSDTSQYNAKHFEENKFYQVALNLDRLRKDELKNTNSILVNIPEFRLHYYDHNGNNTQFNIIVGKKHTPTPVLTSEINRIVANPYWTVPKSITHNELIPKVRKDSSYLQRNGFSIIDNHNNPVNASSIDWASVKPGEFDYWIRQKNIRYNALGVIKFIFPNNRRIYLHDTQSKKLFKKNVRAYSHGCIRVQNPRELAQMILSANKKSKENIDINNIINTKERHNISLDEPIPIYIRYYTCTADDKGNIYYHPDIYSKDQKGIEELINLSTRI